MKKLLTAFLAILILMTSCTNYMESNMSICLDYFYAYKHTATICEDDNYIFFAKEDGIYKKTKHSGIQKNIYKIESPNNLILFNNNLFFTSVDLKKIYKAEIDGRELCTVFDVENLSSEYQNILIKDYFLYNEKIYISSPALSLSCDFDGKTINIINGNCGTSSMEAEKSGLYYIGHSDRKFSIYKCDFDGKNDELFLGNGISKPTEQLYYDFVISDTVFFCAKRLPEKGLFCFDGHFEKKIFDGEIFNLTEKNGKVYFISFKETKAILFSADDAGCKELVELEDYNKNTGFCIVNGTVYFSSSDSLVKSINIE